MQNPKCARKAALAYHAAARNAFDESAVAAARACGHAAATAHVATHLFMRLFML
ncbi:putative immunity protein [Thermosediminibacter oceani]|uniref:putative immunity protein n=1 Tax=Thermosediminibacter oceani TaxID=291990 RepID=UPI003CCAED3E